MDRAGVGEVCLALPAATMDHPFGPGHDAYKVGGKMFALITGFMEAGESPEAGIARDANLVPVILQTANGTVRAETGTIETLAVGAIEARNLKVVISPAIGNIDVLGMNFLSQLASWRVEGRTLILVPPAASGPASAKDRALP